MKTVSDRNEEQAKAQAKAQRVASQAQEHRLAYLATIEAQDIPPKNAQHRDSTRAKIRDGFTGFIDTACNHCKTALVDRHPGITLASSPPKFWADCPGCGADYALRLGNRMPWIPPHT